MTTRANRANLQPKGTTHAPAKAAPKAPSKPASKPAKPASKQLTKPTPPSATRAHQTAATRTPSATAQAAGNAAGAGLKEAIDRRGAAAVLGSPAPAAPSPVTAASVTAKLEAAQPSGPLGLTPGDIREAQPRDHGWLGLEFFQCPGPCDLDLRPGQARPGLSADYQEGDTP